MTLLLSTPAAHQCGNVIAALSCSLNFEELEGGKVPLLLVPAFHGQKDMCRLMMDRGADIHVVSRVGDEWMTVAGSNAWDIYTAALLDITYLCRLMMDREGGIHVVSRVGGGWGWVHRMQGMYRAGRVMLQGAQHGT